MRAARAIVAGDRGRVTRELARSPRTCSAR